MYCKHCGKQISNDSKFCSFCGESLEPSISETNNFTTTEIKNQNEQPAKKELSTGIILVAILYFVNAVYWFFIGSVQATVSDVTQNTHLGGVGLGNIIESFGSVVIGIGVLQTKRWSYNIGLFLAIVDGLIIGSEYATTVENSNLLLFLCLIQVAIIVLLLSNRKTFKKTVQKTSSIIENKIIESIAPETENTKVNEKPFLNLYNTLKEEQKRFFGGYSPKTATLIESICKTKDDTLTLISIYKKTFNSDLIEEIIKLSTNTDSIKRNLAVFIEFEIVESKYPFNRKQ